MYYLQRLRDLREDEDLQQSDIAKLLHTTQPQYSRYETGERELPVRHLVTLADFYKVSTDYILGRTNHKNYIQK
ncbi:MAG: helix-turn-helix domain-containing protein [Oscillospiraceae bacterium]|nr:helix-turn-helix domain-containing protein [Oscillospiraceae bacterium]